jgi:hypothetical protein
VYIRGLRVRVAKPKRDLSQIFGRLQNGQWSMRSCVSRRASARVSLLSGRLKDLPTVSATSILHQAAPEENWRGSFSLEAPFKGHDYAVQCRLLNQEIFSARNRIRVC